jgi:hypothetical protein
MNSLSPQSIQVDEDLIEDSESASFRGGKLKKPKLFSKKQSFLINAG